MATVQVFRLELPEADPQRVAQNDILDEEAARLETDWGGYILSGLPKGGVYRTPLTTGGDRQWLALNFDKISYLMWWT